MSSLPRRVINLLLLSVFWVAGFPGYPALVRGMVVRGRREGVLGLWGCLGISRPTTGNEESGAISRELEISETSLNQDGPVKFDPELSMKRSASERPFSLIEVFKKVAPRYERY